MIVSSFLPCVKKWVTTCCTCWSSGRGRKRRLRMGADNRLFISIQSSSSYFIFLVYFSLALFCCHGPTCVQSKYYDVDSSTSDEAFLVGGRHQSNHYSYSPSSSSHPHPPYKYIPSGNWTEVGVSPPVLNLATKAHIEVNATCGERSPETYCKLVEHAHSSRRNNVRTSQCQVCDAHSSDKGKRHPIRYTIDGSNRWWQSPTLQNGRNYEWVTITIDLKQIYQVAYIIIKSAISPRPGNWILERSVDGYVYYPWQYYAVSDDECWSRYRIRAKPGKPSYSSDEEVICTSYYSQITPFEGGEIHTSLVNGRPGADGPSETLTRFTMARYVRLRLQKIRTLHGDLMTGNLGGGGPLDKSVLRRYFYSIKDISIGGHCLCFGHANECVMDSETGSEKCMCQHNTCGDRCDICCPLYNQYSWGAGNSTDSASCQKCQCYGHADSCIYDRQIHEEGRSININGEYDGGGVCLDCKHHTTGINCNLCVDGYYRPKDVPLDDPSPCLQCACHSEGSTGKCIRNEDEALSYGGGLQPGDCICREGFEGRNCDRCKMGYKNFPRCSPCPCNIFGITNMDCEGDCQCKVNVEGRLCSGCKPGYYDLKKENEDGCTQCFCHGVTRTCASSNFSIVQVSDGQNWFVTDLHGTKTIPAVQLTPQDNDIEDDQQVVIMNNKTYQIANEEFAQFSEYYWTTMPMNVSTESGAATASRFSGNKIHSYGLNVTFHVSWVKARGDTSGRPIPNYDLIIQGTTTSMLGFSYASHEGNNATISAVLNEGNCMVLPDVDNHIVKIQERITLATSYGSSRKPGVPCTRYDVMEVLSNVKRILFRAKYHTDQIEGLMHWAYLEGALVSNGLSGYLDYDGLVMVPGSRATSVEVCDCPKGYTGTSCELCDYGFRKLNKDRWLTECVQCNCNGHSQSCDYEGNCLKCDHNTEGVNCETCVEGFYGDPTTSDSKNICRKCECPLGIPTNNFSPVCRAKGNSYECLSCPIGYDGDFCERCAPGHYGNPAHPGDYCKPCLCSNTNFISSSERNVSKVDICDHLTGECLACPRNTVGWNCDSCAPGHYYENPLNGSCIPCNCSEIGSTSPTNCHPGTGQCQCHDGFGARACDQCLEGHGNPNEGCPSCSCNPVGSLDSICDVVTGQCNCRPGVVGRYCNKCQENFFGFSGGNGCKKCDCDPDGSDLPDSCDLETGQCLCLPHVIGRKCDACEPGWWNIKSIKRCLCDLEGSFGVTCDGVTGQCLCKPGVGGLQCSHCLEGHWGKNHTGCKPCDKSCDKPGHICDPLTGRCVCPPFTEGNHCERCTVGYWGYSPLHGCHPCNCSSQGSSQPQCDITTGKCKCKSSAFEGDKCSECSLGHFGFPSCQPCQCDEAGTLESQCNGENGTCTCNAVTGQCACKENVIGTKCDRCRPGYYGLDEGNPEGCMECFCFHRTNKCSQGYFKWQRFAMPLSPDQSLGPLIRTNTQLRRLNDLMVIPDSARDIIIEKDISFAMPLYWQLPQIFLGDKVLSYNGNLRFHTHSISGVPQFPHHLLATYPIVQIQGNHRLILEHYSANPSSPYTRGFYDVRLHEDDWRLKNGPYNGQVSKEVMMVALQNLQHILIRATYSPEVYNASLFNVSLDIAIPSPSNDKTMAHGIEVCDCPPEYNSTSCQNPRIGWYRWYKRDYITSTVIIDLVGEARRCDCNGRASSCDTETGRCQNCLENTSGPRCDQCQEGYYGNPVRGRCLPCPCPSVWNNHAKSCHQRSSHPQWPPPPPQQHHGVVPGNIKWHCTCLQGYTGLNCDRCDYGYHGRPWERGGSCIPCKCNLYGSVSDECDEITGQCNCRPGVTGRDCSKCKERHVIVGKECTSCDDQCTGTLLNDLLDINGKLSGLKVDPEAVFVFKKLVNLDEGSKRALAHWNNHKGVGLFLDDLPGYQNLAGMMGYRLAEMRQTCDKTLGDSYMLVERGKIALDMLEAVHREIRANVKYLQDYVGGRLRTGEASELAQRELGDVISQLEQTSMDLQEVTHAAEDELAEINTLFDELLVKIFNATGKAGTLVDWMKSARVKIDQFEELIEKCRRNVNEAGRIMTLAKEHLDNLRSNINLLDDIAMGMDRVAVDTQTTLHNSGYLKTELEQVLFMIEDMLREFRNTTKELEIRDNLLFDRVPLYRVLHAQPAFDRELELIMQQKYIEGVFGPLVGHGNGTQSKIQAVTAFERMRTGFITALAKARNATELGRITELEIENILEQYPQAGMLETSSTLVDSVLALSAQLENGPLRRNLTDCKSSLDKLQWNTKVANQSVRQMNTKLDGYLEQDMKLPELIERITEISETIQETSQTVMETDAKVHNELKARIDAIRGGAPFDSVDAAIQVNRVSHQIPQVEHDLIQGERRLHEIAGKNRESIQDRLKHLKALIQQSRHKANTVGVAIGPDDTGTCFRVYTLPQLMDDSATSLRFNFAPTRTQDSLLVYWPSSLNEDFVSIEMINLHIRVSWDLGSGTRTLTHQRKLHPISLNSDDPDHWWEIKFERIGSSVTLHVNPLSEDHTSPPQNNAPIKYINSDEEATLLNLAPSDYLHVGGMSREKRPGLTDNGMLSGCIHNLHVNNKSVGLWNFARTEGCQACVECQDAAMNTMEGSTGDLEYYFDGRGYAVMERIRSQTYNSKEFYFSMEFKTFSENGLLFLTVNQTIGQMISVELKEGRILMQVRHRWGAQEEKDILRVETDPPEVKYNTGEWTYVGAVWVYHDGTQTARLTVGNKDFLQQKRSNGGQQLSLKLHQAHYQVGGVSPTFDPTKWDHVLPVIVPYVGCIRKVLVGGSTYDPMAGHYFGVESPCGGKTVYVTSFEGNGYAEFGSISIGKYFKMGFTFKTVQPTGLMVLSTFAKGPESPDEHYYAVYLDQGKVNVQLGVPQGPFDLSSNGTLYDDGRYHSVRIIRNKRKFYLYVDDEELTEYRILRNLANMSVNAPKHRGLFIGGTTPSIQRKFEETPLQVRGGFSGCIKNLHFGNDLVNFNYPVSYENQNLGQCPKHHEPDPLLVKYLFPNMGIDSSAVVRFADSECTGGGKTSDDGNPVVIEQEEPFKAWNFGDSPNSYATLSLVSSKILRQSFNISFHFRTFYPNGMFFQGLRKKSNGGSCLMSFLKDGQVIVKIHGNKPQDLVSSVSGLNDGKWHHIVIIKAEDKMYLHIDGRNATQTQVPKIKAISKMHIGGVPSDGHDCLENSIHKPEYFKGCLKNFIINSHFYNLDSNSAQLNNVSPCFSRVEPGTFFRSGSYAIYSHNFTLGTVLEVQMDFKSDSRNGLLLSLVPNKLSSKYPQFSIFLRDGKVIARETISGDEYYEALEDFEPDKGYVCDGHWHTIRATYERGSITLKVDGKSLKFGLADPESPHSTILPSTNGNNGGYLGGTSNGGSTTRGSSSVGTIYIGGVDDGASRSNTKLQFHGCIRNIVLNRQFRDWTDMALIHNVYLNSCPL